MPRTTSGWVVGLRHLGVGQVDDLDVDAALGLARRARR
jgi:hypothetical protein